MRRLRIACIVIFIGMVATLPFHQQVMSATGNRSANQHEIGNPIPFQNRFAEGPTASSKDKEDYYGWMQPQVPGPINITNPSAALSAVPAVCLVFETSWFEGLDDRTKIDGRWNWKKDGKQASIKTEAGELTYTFEIPGRICPEGSNVTISAKVMANERSRYSALISVGGEVKDKMVVAQAVAEPGETKSQTSTETFHPLDNYSEGSSPTIRITLHGGSPNGLVFVYRYRVE